MLYVTIFQTFTWIASGKNRVSGILDATESETHPKISNHKSRVIPIFTKKTALIYGFRTINRPSKVCFGIPANFYTHTHTHTHTHTLITWPARYRMSIFLHKKYKKKLRYKSIRFFCKVIPKSFRFGYNTWSKSNIYNINNNFKLAWSKFKWVWLQYQTQ
jgi:hypothetical protein